MGTTCRAPTANTRRSLSASTRDRGFGRTFAPPAAAGGVAYLVMSAAGVTAAADRVGQITAAAAMDDCADIPRVNVEHVAQREKVERAFAPLAGDPRLGLGDQPPRDG